MRSYKFDDFTLGEGVYHKSNTRIKMIVIRLLNETMEIKCRLIDKDGSKNEEVFLFAELVKSNDHDRDNRPRYITVVP